MLFDPKYFPWWSISCLLFTVFLCVCAGYTYRVNASRSTHDPNKRDFHPGAVFLAIFAWPILLLLYTGLLLLGAIAFGVSLLVITFALVTIRKPFLMMWLAKVFTTIGNPILELNTALLYTLLGKESKEPPS